jgi:beta/gamma crystallin
MKKSHFGIAALLSIAGLALSVVPTSTSANSAAAQIAPVQGTDAASDELSAQGRRGGGGFGGGMRGGGGNIGRIGGQGQQGRIGRQEGRIGRIDGRIGRQQGRIGRQEGRIGRIDGRIGRVGYRYGRVGRIGYVPVPVPMGPGPGPGPGLGVVTPPCLVCPVQACLIAVYADPNLTGATFETRDNQPRLDQVAPGWQNQISSVMVKGGTWEFYPDLEYRGGPPVLRLAPGSYVVLEPQWTKRIGSFMCVR